MKTPISKELVVGETACCVRNFKITDFESEIKAKANPSHYTMLLTPQKMIQIFGIFWFSIKMGIHTH